MKVRFQTTINKDIKGNQFTVIDGPILDFFVENQAKLDDLTYVITYQNYLKKDDSEYSNKSDFLVYQQGHKVIVPHLIRGKRYFGNTKLVRCDPSDLRNTWEYERLIRINKSYHFFDSMLFVIWDGITYRLKENEGFLQLNIWQRQTVKIL
jgi:hypothetical protein